MKNPAGFGLCHTTWRKTRRVLDFVTRHGTKPGGFHIPAHGCAKNAPDFPYPNKDTPKTCPVLGANPCRKTFGGVCFCALHGYTQNLAGFIPPYTDKPKTHPVLGVNLRRRTFRGVCNTPLHGYVKNPPGFTHPNKDIPKTRSILDPNLCRGVFRGVCNTPLHGYVKNLAGFIFPHPNTPKTHLISPFPIRIRPKPARFYAQTVVKRFFGTYAFAPYTGT